CSLQPSTVLKKSFLISVFSLLTSVSVRIIGVCAICVCSSSLITDFLLLCSITRPFYRQLLISESKRSCAWLLFGTYIKFNLKTAQTKAELNSTD
uniref:Uncharacterized protein n=1 Tax=Labrus bergylta TaxID=56723 RepID=A0A3Q3GCT5_9LABR